jgi:hypothetical protein
MVVIVYEQLFMGAQVFWTELYFARIGIAWLFRQALGILLMVLAFIVLVIESAAQGEWTTVAWMVGGAFAYFYIGAKVIRWFLRLLTRDAEPDYTLDEIVEQDRVVREKSAGHTWFELSDVPLHPANTGKAAKGVAADNWKIGGPSAFGRQAAPSGSSFSPKGPPGA